LSVRVATVLSTPTGSSAGSSPVTYPSTIAVARSRYHADCAWSAKPSSIQPRPTSAPAAATVRIANGSRHQPASALWTAAPTLLCAHGGPLAGVGRSR
jgi:hypothetical protein